jgi:hypothetical protein
LESGFSTGLRGILVKSKPDNLLQSYKR